MEVQDAATDLKHPAAPEVAQLPIRLSDVGARLRAFRMGRGLSPEALAEAIALYRAEKGQIAKIDTLTRIAEVLGVSLPNLLGVGMECVDNGVAFFERMRQLEQQSEEVIGLFGPVSYLLTSENYDAMLEEVLQDTVPEDPAAAEAARQSSRQLLEVLRERKRNYQRRRLRIVSLISASDIERILMHGVIGRHDLAEDVAVRRRRMARREVEHVAGLLRRPPAGVQIGVIREATPATTFQIFRQRDRSVLAISPFRLGEQLNVHLGVALITSADEPMVLHQRIAGNLWQHALKGEEAAGHLDRLIERYAIR
jgi:transcriptional regulator with XRE-family HTH domain